MLEARRQVGAACGFPHLTASPLEKTLQHNTRGLQKRIFLVDRHPLIREGLAHMLGKEPDLTVCGQAADGSVALPGIITLNAHAVVMDLTIEDGSGVNVIERIVHRAPHTAVLVLSTRDEAHYATRLLRAGARGYISKTEPTRKIIAALRCVLHGKLYLGPATPQLLLRSSVAQPPALSMSNGSLVAVGLPSIETLSDRELEVFAMTGHGMSTRRIADILHLSPKTIQAYHGRIKDKLQLCDATELMREAICWVESAGKRNRRTPRPPDDDGTADIGGTAWFH